VANNKTGWVISFYEDHRGNIPALDFINRLPIKDQAKINKVLSLLKEFGPSLGMPHARHIIGDLWELRPGDNRILYFLYTGRQFVILHGFRKTTNKTPAHEIETALRRIEELQEE
jgi:phage-related protein